MTRRILIIEDQEDMRQLLETVLREAGYRPEFAEDGDAGLQAVRRAPHDAEGRYAAVILDLMMPRMHGYEVIQHLRASPATARLPVIVLSAKAYPSDQRKAFDMGATAFVCKPFRPEDVVAAVRQALAHTVLTFWGVRGSIAAPGPETVRYGGNTPCVSVEHDGRTLVLDAGTGIRKLGLAMQAAAGSQPLTVDLLVSHTHWDHIQGFPFFVPAYVPGNKIRVVGPRTPDKPLEKVLRGQMDSEYFPVALGDMAADIQVDEYRGVPLDIGPFHVSCEYLNHPGVTLGFRIEVGGLTIAYATDTEPMRRLLAKDGGEGGESIPSAEKARFGHALDQSLVRLVRGADVYIADAQYFPEEYSKKTGWGHTCYLDAVDLAIEAGVKRLVLFSHDPMHDDDAIDRKLAHCRAIVAERGVRLEVVAAAEGVPLLVPAPKVADVAGAAAA